MLRNTVRSGIALVAFYALSCAATATSIVYPHFSAIEAFGDRFTAVSPDGRSLRCLTLDGRELWRRSLTADARVARYDREGLLVQEESTVLLVRVADGRSEELFKIPEHQIFVRDSQNGIEYLTDRRFEVNALQLLEPATRRPLWKRGDIETIIGAWADLIVVVTARRTYDAGHQSYTTGDAAIEAVERESGRTRWRVVLKDEQAVGVEGIVTAECVVAIDRAPGGGLLCIDAVSGRIVGRRDNPTDFGLLDYPDVVADSGGIAFLEGGSRDGEAFLRFASVPSFSVRESVRLVDGEMFQVTLHDVYVITRGLYSAAAFERRTGRRLWERGQVGDWRVLDRRILFSDYDRRRRHARIGVLEIATGRERIILRERADFPSTR